MKDEGNSEKPRGSSWRDNEHKGMAVAETIMGAKKVHLYGTVQVVGRPAVVKPGVHIRGSGFLPPSIPPEPLRYY